MFGPKVVLTKKTDVSFVKPGDTVNVMVIAENTGNAYTKVTVRDSLPDNVTLIGGSTGFEGVLEATRNVSFSYTLRIDSKKPIILPAATAEYYEFEARGRKITTRSQGVEITIKSPEIIST
ncbi:MAG: hypothetical protein O8C64_16100 [Candidatus Methanoperedens sp.]|nr:hypothetical protein [Candidatus Methanoperedens sp.]